MNRNRTFEKTRLPDLRKSLEAAYGHDKGCAIFTDAENILDAELSSVDDRGNKMVGKHIRCNILPGYACYLAMLDMGISSAEAVEFVKIELCRSVERMTSLCKRMSLKIYTYELIRFLMSFILKYGYPRQGWTLIMHENSKEKIRFDMTSCLYCEELQKRGALELCSAYCYTDVASYAPLSPAVLFIREDTLAQMGVKCDFCFQRGKVTKKRI